MALAQCQEQKRDSRGQQVEVVFAGALPGEMARSMFGLEIERFGLVELERRLGISGFALRLTSPGKLDLPLGLLPCCQQLQKVNGAILSSVP